MRLALKIAGSFLFLLALAQPLFYWYFGWRSETAKLSQFTRQVFHVHGFFIAVALLMMAAVSVFYAGDLLSGSRLAKAILASFAVFWALRLVVQLFVYDSSVWRGSLFRTAAHGAFSVFWAYLAGVYAICLLSN